MYGALTSLRRMSLWLGNYSLVGLKVVSLASVISCPDGGGSSFHETLEHIYNAAQL